MQCQPHWLVMHQVSSVELERVVMASVPAVLEAAAVGLTPPGGGPEQLIMFLVLHPTAQASHSLQAAASSSSSSANEGATSQGQGGVQSGQQQDSGKSGGTASSVDSLGEAFHKVKAVAAEAASKVTDVAVVAMQGGAGSSAGQQQHRNGDQADLHELKLKCQQAIRSSLNPLFKLERVLLRDSLPRTASNKVMRRLLRDELRQTLAKL